jgi:histidine ammonia-lyase
MLQNFNYGTDKLTVGHAIVISSGKIKGVLADPAIKKINNSQQYVQDIVENNKTVYGVNTGFGILATTKISEEDTATLQHKILQSHSVGVGEAIPEEIAKLMLITKVHALAQGYSGVRLETLERICWHIDNDVIPVVPEKGSVGASGDLAPLSHLFLPLIGLGQVDHKGKRYKARDILNKFSLKPIHLGPKEGLALIKRHTSFNISFCCESARWACEGIIAWKAGRYQSGHMMFGSNRQGTQKAPFG